MKSNVRSIFADSVWWAGSRGWGRSREQQRRRWRKRRRRRRRRDFHRKKQKAEEGKAKTEKKI